MKTFIFGGSGHAREVYWIIKEINKKSKEIIDVDKFVVADNDPLLGSKYDSILIISESEYFKKHVNYNHNCVLAIGSSKIRRIVFNKILSKNVFFPNLIHPSVIYDETRIKLGIGIVIGPNVTMTTDIAIDEFVHINIGSTISHDAKIGAFTTISPGAHIAGNVTLKENVFIGINAVIIEKISICEDAIIGAGAVVVKKIYNSGTYIGIPAKKIM
ncbi:acetyltransferase [Flavobacterium sp. N3904]|uniref:acetyltransferase n=1 Tax=Flavobacterium sp. N3904 TaxID=2986835 RepID=UPI0022250D56|nr:acetyltransferase [Flavobacterium sp. N3904]